MCVFLCYVYMCVGGVVHVSCGQHPACPCASFPSSAQLHYSELVPRVAPGGSPICQPAVYKRASWHWSETYQKTFYKYCTYSRIVVLGNMNNCVCTDIRLGPCGSIDVSSFDFSLNVLSSHYLACTRSLIISFTLKWRQMGDHMHHEHYDRHSFSFILPPAQSLCL